MKVLEPNLSGSNTICKEDVKLCLNELSQASDSLANIPLLEEQRSNSCGFSTPWNEGWLVQSLLIFVTTGLYMSTVPTPNAPYSSSVTVWLFQERGYISRFVLINKIPKRILGNSE